MIKYLLKKIGFIKPVVTVEYGKTDKENQIQEILIYKDGKYSHTVLAHYFTEEQLSLITNLEDNGS